MLLSAPRTPHLVIDYRSQIFLKITIIYFAAVQHHFRKISEFGFSPVLLRLVFLALHLQIFVC
jgi:hypothetical protein